MAFTTLPLHVMGTRVMGDLGGFTMYTDRHRRKVIYQKAPPNKPASPMQADRRKLFGDAIRAWKALTDDEKATLERTVAKTSLCLTGQNLFTSCSLCSRSEMYLTIGRQAGEVLPPLAVLQ